MNLPSLLRALPAYEIHNERNVEITRITPDSRQVIPGALFVAIPGVNVDGAHFIPDALSRGAIAIVTESNDPTIQLSNYPTILVPNARSALAHLSAAWHDFPSRKLRVVGVTGTDGKTTTARLIASILESAGHKVGAISTIGATTGDQEIDTGLHTTTPDAPDVQRYLAQMVDADAEYAVIEATSEGLAQRRLDAVEFDIAVVTNITHEHLYYHKTWENYRDAKAMLFRALATSYRKPRTAKVAVLNADDNARGVFDYLRAIEVEEQIVYSTDDRRRTTDGSNLESSVIGHRSSVCIFARAIHHSPHGLRFTIVTPHGELEIESPLIGRYNVSNILAAIGAGLARRVPFDALREGIARVRGIVGRMEVLQSDPFTVIVDFAHTPNALRNALATARELAHNRVIVVFGCAGLRDVQKRALMGEIAGKLADKIIVTAEDPRTESLDAINAQIIEGLERAGRRARDDYFVVDDRARAIAFAIEMARAGDVVIVCGKGHERSMCFGATEIPWSDQDAVSQAKSKK
ncbi:MAG: UDP-N-acetylmuramoyl-L-alanyl-D-glutamate--2,6-diaminopimelate ligase [Chloroflexi bacterium]|nr:UDP-N-acetylmuramoyl-L-alanyl-D-glutamate--2,6-diaminopimelate ligase [Chloroflexota bacterium]